MTYIEKVKSFIGIVGTIVREYRLSIGLLVILGFLSGIFEGIGVNALIPLFSFATGETVTSEDPISGLIITVLETSGLTLGLSQLLAVVIILFLARAVVLYLFNFIKIKITADYEYKLRNKLTQETFDASWPHLLQLKLGHLENVLMTDVRLGSTILQKVSLLIMAGSSILVYVVIAFMLSAKVALFAFGGGFFIFLVYRPFVRRIRAAAVATGKFNKVVAHYVNESAVGMKTLKAADVVTHVALRLRGYFDELRKLKIRQFMLTNATGVLLQPLSLVFITLLFIFSYRLPDFQLASFVVIVYLVYRIFQYLNQFQGNLFAAIETVPFLETALSFSGAALKEREKIGGDNDFAFSKELVFSDVNFSYNPPDEVLRKLSFVVRKGEMIGLIGPSGSGKTTIVDLLLRLLIPTKGKISIDGKNIDAVSLADWRRNIGYVSQEIFLMNDTIEKNITFYDDAISYEEVVKAAQDASISDFIETLPKKLDTTVGERGLHLSGGQRQRIIIARVLARKPKILVLDEATSALDNESEVKIQQVIEKLKGKMSILIIAHRLSTVMHCDRLMVLGEGKIIEEGTPQELLKDQSTRFYQLYNIRE